MEAPSESHQEVGLDGTAGVVGGHGSPETVVEHDPECAVSAVSGERAGCDLALAMAVLAVLVASVAAAVAVEDAGVSAAFSAARKEAALVAELEHYHHLVQAYSSGQATDSASLAVAVAAQAV